MRILISVLALLVSASMADAACQTTSLAGSWHYFASNVVFRADGTPDFTYVEDCSFRITRGGIVRNSTCIDGTSEVPWGSTDFSVAQNCSIIAQTPLCDLSGQIAKDKDTVSGIGECCCYEDAPGSGNFTLEYQNSFELVKKTAAGGAAATRSFFPAQVNAAQHDPSTTTARRARASRDPS